MQGNFMPGDASSREVLTAGTASLQHSGVINYRLFETALIAALHW